MADYGRRLAKVEFESLNNARVRGEKSAHLAPSLVRKSEESKEAGGLLTRSTPGGCAFNIAQFSQFNGFIHVVVACFPRQMLEREGPSQPQMVAQCFGNAIRPDWHDCHRKEYQPHEIQYWDVRYPGSAIALSPFGPCSSP